MHRALKPTAGHREHRDQGLEPHCTTSQTEKNASLSDNTQSSVGRDVVSHLSGDSQDKRRPRPPTAGGNMGSSTGQL